MKNMDFLRSMKFFVTALKMIAYPTFLRHCAMPGSSAGKNSNFNPNTNNINKKLALRVIQIRLPLISNQIKWCITKLFI
jgi:hypothetical protein